MIIALNNKCNLTKEEFMSYQNQLNKIECQDKLILCPNHLFIGMANLENIDLGAQNVSSTDCGAYTGEISASQLKSCNVKYCIVGHSERRKYQQETDIEINQKIKKLLEQDITPILCIGETKEERENRKEKEIILNELEEDLKNLSEQDRTKVIIAYEPIWSIGTGIIPTEEQITEIFNIIKDKFPNNKVLYGGSANEENIDMLKQISSIDGYLLGGLSLKPDKLKIFIEKLKN